MQWILTLSALSNILHIIRNFELAASRCNCGIYNTTKQNVQPIEANNDNIDFSWYVHTAECAYCTDMGAWLCCHGFYSHYLIGLNKYPPWIAKQENAIEKFLPFPRTDCSWYVVVHTYRAHCQPALLSICFHLDFLTLNHFSSGCSGITTHQEKGERPNHGTHTEVISYCFVWIVHGM